MNQRVLLIISAAFIISFSIGCSHKLTLTNENDYYFSTPYFDDPVSVGVVSPSSSLSEVFLNEVVDNMRIMGDIKVVYPYTYSKNNPVDYLVDFSVIPTYDGDGNNFIVSFPGFLIFAPWWHGYNYGMDLTTKVTITDYKANETILSDSYQTTYKCVHSQFDRTWTQGADWFLTWGVSSLIGGIYFTTYDEDITNEFTRSVSQPYGKYISRKIGTSIKSIDKNKRITSN